MQLGKFLTLAAIAVASSGGAVAQESGQEMVSVVIGTVVPVPIDQAAMGCGTSAEEIRSHMSGMQTGSETATADTGDAGTDADSGADSGTAAGGETSVESEGVAAAENTGGVTGTGPDGDTGALTGTALDELNIVCIIGAEAAALAGLPADEVADQ